MSIDVRLLHALTYAIAIIVLSVSSMNSPSIIVEVGGFFDFSDISMMIYSQPATQFVVMSSCNQR